jgi:hypothetical protein
MLARLVFLWVPPYQLDLSFVMLQGTIGLTPAYASTLAGLTRIRKSHGYFFRCGDRDVNPAGGEQRECQITGARKRRKVCEKRTGGAETACGFLKNNKKASADSQP